MREIASVLFENFETLDVFRLLRPYRPVMLFMSTLQEFRAFAIGSLLSATSVKSRVTPPGIRDHFLFLTI